VTRLAGVIVELFDSNSMDERMRISFNFFWSEAGETTVSAGTAGEGIIGRDGVFGIWGSTREGLFVTETFWDRTAGAEAFGEGVATITVALVAGAFGDGAVGEEAFIDRPAMIGPD
jgi:hypothetical protein